MHTAARLALAALFASVSAASGSASALGCDGHLIAVGDNVARVRSLCGEPDGVTRSVVTRTEARGNQRVGSALSVSVEVERWLFDLGPYQFMEELVFEDGILRSVRNAGQGTDRGHPR